MLQLRGYADAITSEEVTSAVRSGRHGRIGLTFVAWSDASRQDQLVPWKLIEDEAAAADFAATLLGAPHPMPGYTSISGAIDFSVSLLARCDFVSERQVIDISGDGVNNDGRPVAEARDAAMAAGITINGLPIVRRDVQVAAYYAQNVIAGPAAFLVVAAEMASFHSAVLRKLVTEIATGPMAGAAA
jgi:hypothetical protein